MCSRVQKKSRLHGCEPKEDFVFYVVFEEGLVNCVKNPVSEFSVNAKSIVKGIALLQENFSRHKQCRVKEHCLVSIVLKQEGILGKFDSRRKVEHFSVLACSYVDMET